MARPEKYEDIDPYDQKGKILAIFRKEIITTFPTVGKEILGVLKAAEYYANHGKVEIVDTGINIEIVIVPTDSEKEAKLNLAKDDWDRVNGLYKTALSNWNLIPSWQRAYIDRWAENNNLSPVVWGEVENE